MADAYTPASNVVVTWLVNLPHPPAYFHGMREA
jgi:hypothetical protein